MTTASFCPHCGKPLSGDAPQGLCPSCLLQAALPGQTGVIDQAQGRSAYGGDPPEAGARVEYFGDYELVEEVARGGMGVVWKARQTSLNRTVALKMLRAGSLAGADEVERFHREAEAAANLQHPNIVAIHEVGEHAGEHYFSMDYVSGRDLGAVLRDGPLAARRAARYVRIVAGAIHFAHQCGTLHRDLKPQNVLIDAADQPRVTDFGLAKLATRDSRLTQPGVVMGSPSYMPPEQADARHGEVGPHSDVYSLGALLYELLTGRPPFQGATVRDTLLQVMEAEPVPPRRLKADVPPDLETICLKCLEKPAALRYHSARELAEDLDRFLRDEPVLARPPGAVRKLLGWGRHHRGVVAAAAAVVLIALAFATFYLVEENAYLRAVHAGEWPGRPAGPSTFLEKVVGRRMWQGDDGLWHFPDPGASADLLLRWLVVNLFVSCTGLFVLAALYRRSQRLGWEQFFDLGQLARPRQPVGEAAQRLAVGAVVACLASGVGFLVVLIRVQVWEQDVPWANYLGVFTSVWTALLLAAALACDYRLTHRGAASRNLTPEQLEAVRRALAGRRWAAAMSLYQQAVPDAGFFEAEQNLRLLFPELYPKKWQLPPLTPATANWRAAVACAFIQCALTGLLCLAFPPASAATFFWNLTAALLFALGLLALLAVQEFWKHLLLLAPSVAMMVLGREMLLCFMATGALLGLGLVAALKCRGFWQGALMLAPPAAMALFIFSALPQAPSPATEVWPSLAGLLFPLGPVAAAYRRRGRRDVG